MSYEQGPASSQEESLLTIDEIDRLASRNGNPSETLLYAKQDRLENWRLLQELAGLR